jgi:hypothetical protein
VRLLLDPSFSVNEKLCMNAKKYLARFACATSPAKYSAFIASQIDFINVNTLSKYLDVLRAVLRSADGRDLGHLHFTAFSLCEGDNLFPCPLQSLFLFGVETRAVD